MIKLDLLGVPRNIESPSLRLCFWFSLPIDMKLRTPATLLKFPRKKYFFGILNIFIGELWEKGLVYSCDVYLLGTSRSSQRFSCRAWVSE